MLYGTLGRSSERFKTYITFFFNLGVFFIIHDILFEVPKITLDWWDWQTRRWLPSKSWCFILTDSKRREYPTPRAAMWGSNRGSQEAERGEENVGKSLCCSSQGKEWVRFGCLTNFTGLWGEGFVSPYLVPDPGMIRAGEQWPGV